MNDVRSLAQERPGRGSDGLTQGVNRARKARFFVRRGGPFAHRPEMEKPKMTFTARRLAPLVAAVLAAGPVAAAEKPSVAVLPYAPLFGEVAQSAGDKGAQLVSDELAANKELAVVTVSDGAAKADKDGKPGEAEIELAKKEIAEAKSQFEKAAGLAEKKKVKPAADAYEKAITKYLLSFQGADSFQALSDAYVQLAINRFKLGDEDEALKLLDEVVRLDPRRVLQPPEVPPLFAKFHDKARKAQFAKGRGRIRISTTPAGARVVLDGRDVGETPLVAKDVLPGEHFVRIWKEGTGATWKKVKVVAGEESVLNADLGGEATGRLAILAKALGNNAVTPEVGSAAKAVAQASKADFVIFGVMHKEEENLLVKSWALRAKDGAVAQLADLTFDVEMLGAAIEVFKLSSDFAAKSRDFQGVPLESEIIPFPDAKAAKSDEQVTEISITPSLDGPKDADAVASEGRGGRRGPVRAVTEERRPVAAPADEKSEEGDDASAGRVRRRVRGRIGEETAPAKVEAPAKSEEPAIEVSGDDEVSRTLREEDEAEKKTDDKGEKKVDLKLKNTGRNVSSLDPSELSKLDAIKEDDNGGSSAGKIALWTGVGVVGAGAIATVLYFVLTPSEPTSATAHISW